MPLFKVVDQFQGLTIFLDNQDNMTVSMLDIQFMRYFPLFGYTQAPTEISSNNDQSSDSFLKNLNNTTSGIVSGHIYDSRRADTGKGINISIAYLGFYDIGVTDKSIDDGDHS